ncbi:DVU3141 family protein [Oceanisphaera sp. IT1-181]|uniref:DVU3141 family protein n=1 Tax=Oceanisphaera sp. IT1-181 TaxID=3081199 RepID=UPI0029CA9861|nr:DVU3141 family protein [Oceanisphaera sp. IT1-181]
MLLSRKRILTPLFALVILTTSGCVSQHQNNGNTQPTVDNVALSQYLNANTASATLLSESPWGSNVEVLADQAYFAASGRPCRQLQISQPNGNIQHQIACQLPSGDWAITRDPREL